MKKNSILLLLVAGFLLSSCAAYEKKAQSGAAVEVNGQYLYRSSLDSLTLGLGAEDSLRVVQQYVSQWAKDELMYSEAEGMKGERAREIERLVTSYRRALYVQAYERSLIERRMPKTIPDSTIVQVYDQMSDRFILDESIVRGILVVVPKEARDIAKLRGWMAKEKLDEIEKYAYASASGYELFTDRWMKTTELLAQMPTDRAALEAALKTKNQIEVSDSLKTYLLQVTEKQLRGEKMPMEYARPEIEKIVLNARETEFLNKERERLYNEAIQRGDVKFY
ncbi:MAG: hypothetical protein II825_07860 [Paludibacteraceae bacterium]|nr:hypothetical protein [Paludibacteraceae bacterium]